MSGSVIESKRAPEPVGLYPHARRVGGLLFLSGIGPRVRGSKEIPGVTLGPGGSIERYDLEAQVRSVFANVRAVLEDSGARFEDLVDVTCYLTNMKDDFATWNRIWAETFPDPATRPCRTTLEVNALPTPIAVELKCIAASQATSPARDPHPIDQAVTMLKPLNFQRWIDEHRHLLKPPVGNAQIWADREFMVTVVGGPNARTDFHINEGEEFFYQLEGTMNLRMLIDGQQQDLPIGPGEIFLLPPDVPHSPQRPTGTVGLVLERRRLEHERDSFLWVCDRCGADLYKETFHLTDIVTQLPPVFARYWSSPANTTCKRCGQTHERPARPEVVPESAQGKAPPA